MAGPAWACMGQCFPLSASLPPSALQGMGAGFIPKVLDVDLLDEVVTVSWREAVPTPY